MSNTVYEMISSDWCVLVDMLDGDSINCESMKSSDNW